MNVENYFSMIQQASENIGNGIAAIQSFCEEFTSFSDGHTFELDRTISGRDISVADVIAIAELVVAYFDSIGEQSDLHLLSRGRVDTLLNQSSNFKVKAEQVQQHVRQVSQQNAGIQSFNYDNFHLAGKNGNKVDVRNVFHQLVDSIYTLFDQVIPIIPFMFPEKGENYTATISSLSGAIARIEKTYSELRASKKRAQDIENRLGDIQKNVEESANETGRFQQETANDRKTASEYLAEITTKTSDVEAVHAKSQELKATIDAYQDNFNKFQKQLDDREKTFVAGTQNLTELISDFEAQRESIESLIKQSEDMLSSATTTGLAVNFHTLMTDTSKDMKGARKMFYWGIAFLFVSSLPLLAFIIFPVIAPFLQDSYPHLVDFSKQFGANSQQTGWQYLGQVIARLVILVPAAWFVSFSAIRHSSLFRLREHYAYKYSMAASVDGFKKQASDYEQEIAALVLEQLAFNPADKLLPSKDIAESKSPNPISQFLLEKIKSRFDKENS